MRREKQDMIRFVLQSKRLNRPISTGWVSASLDSIPIVQKAIADVLQSYEQFILDDGVFMNIMHQRLLSSCRN